MATNYDEMTLEELRQEAKQRELSGVWDMTKPELVEALRQRGGDGGGQQQSERGGGQAQHDESDEDLGERLHAKVINSLDEHEDRPGQSLVTRNHDVIKRWAEERNASPATVPGTRHGDRLGVLRFDFPGYGGQDLEEVSWDEWFKTFDERGLNFLYQEHLKKGDQSNFFRLENPEREDA